MLLLTIILLLSILSNVHSDDIPFTLDPIFQDKMVLQKDPATPAIWGTGPIGSLVVLIIESARYEGTVDDKGKWKMFVGPHVQTEFGTALLLINNMTDDKIYIDDVIFGDIYVCSGQSNMEFVIKDGFNATETFSEAESIGDKIRLLTIAHNFVPEFSEDTSVKILQNWSYTSPESLGANLTKSFLYFSAVCYYYGLTLYKQLKVPIGLISAAWEGTTVEVWSPAESVSKCTGITKGNYPNNVTSSLWNGMIYPISSMTIKGAIWYQGENNIVAPGDYKTHSGYQCLFPEMINGWRKYFSMNGMTDPNFPFGFVMLAGFCGNDNHLCHPEQQTHELRWAQTVGYGYSPNRILTNVFFANAVDLEDPLTDAQGVADGHPRNKLDVGQRLGNAALGLVYKFHSHSITGPIVEGCQVAGNSIEIVLDTNSYKGEEISMNNQYGIEILDDQDKWTRFNITNLSSNKITIEYSSINNIKSIRYLWQSNPCCPQSYEQTTPFTCEMKRCGIYTSITKLPLPPFRYEIINGNCVVQQ